MARCPDAIAGVGEPLPVVSGLRAVFGDGEAGELVAVAAEFRDPADHRESQHGLGVCRFRIEDESVAAFAGDGARVADAFEVPVVSAVVGIQLPVVATGVVAAVAVERTV